MKLTTNRISPALSALALCVLGPLLISLLSGIHLGKEAQESWSIVRPTLLNTTIDTLSLALLTTSLSFMLGVGLAFATTTTNLWFKKILHYCMLVPLAIPLYVFGFVYVGILEYSGPIHTFLRSYGLNIHQLIPLKSLWGVSTIFSFALFPYVYLSTYNSIRTSSQELIDVARVLGASKLRVLTRVVFPMVRHSAIAGAMIVSMEVISDFGGVSVFNYPTLSTRIFDTWIGLFSFEAASRIAAILLLVGIASHLVWGIYGTKQTTCPESRRSPEEFFTLGPWQNSLLSLGCWSIVALSSVVPIGSLLWWSASSARPHSVEQYLKLSADSILLATICAMIILTFGLLATLVAKTRKGPKNSLLVSTSQIGYAIPGSVIAISVLGLFATSSVLSSLSVSFWISVGALTLCYFIRFFSIAYRNIETAVSRIPWQFDAIAASLGIGRYLSWWRIHLPLALKVMPLTLTVVLVEILKEMPMTMILRPTGLDTLATKIYELTSEGEWELASFPALILITLSLLAQFGFKRMLRHVGPKN